MVNSPKSESKSNSAQRKLTKNQLFLVNTVKELKAIPRKKWYSNEEALFNSVGMFILQLSIDDVRKDNPTKDPIEIVTENGVITIAP
jgi:hypothetical protein